MTQLKQTDRSSSSFLERADSDIDDHGLLSACSSNESFDSPIDDHLRHASPIECPKALRAICRQDVKRASPGVNSPDKVEMTDPKKALEMVHQLKAHLALQETQLANLQRKVLTLSRVSRYHEDNSVPVAVTNTFRSRRFPVNTCLWHDRIPVQAEPNLSPFYPTNDFHRGFIDLCWRPSAPVFIHPYLKSTAVARSCLAPIYGNHPLDGSRDPCAVPRCSFLGAPLRPEQRYTPSQVPKSGQSSTPTTTSTSGDVKSQLVVPKDVSELGTKAVREVKPNISFSESPFKASVAKTTTSATQHASLYSQIGTNFRQQRIGLPPGVWYDRVEKRYVVQCYDTTSCGRRKRKYFSVSRYGEEKAKQLAIGARLQVIGCIGSGVKLSDNSIQTLTSSSSSSKAANDDGSEQIAAANPAAVEDGCTTIKKRPSGELETKPENESPKRQKLNTLFNMVDQELNHSSAKEMEENCDVEKQPSTPLETCNKEDSTFLIALISALGTEGQQGAQRTSVVDLPNDDDGCSAMEVFSFPVGGAADEKSTSVKTEMTGEGVGNNERRRGKLGLRSETKLKGVSFLSHSNVWRARWVDGSCKEVSRCFSIEKFGFAQARKLAVAARLEAEECGEACRNGVPVKGKLIKHGLLKC